VSDHQRMVPQIVLRPPAGEHGGFITIHLPMSATIAAEAMMALAKLGWELQRTEEQTPDA
jgi:hypothetical protein